ncbi:hypothetical protein SCB49_13460 [unidentified eubacterium SCB49]|nr:hypothetical protein SCB49_13460 [unidentified eubacterium SCB49]
MEANKNPNRDYWNKDDLRVYILLYCANADLITKEEELEYITGKINSAKYNEIKKEFKNDNDYQSIQKIEESIGHLGYDKAQLEQLVVEIKELFWSDGQFDSVERAILLHLQRILNV